MRYLAFLMRLAILVIWFLMMIKNPMVTPPFCSWVVFVILAVYLSMLAKHWPDALSCPFNKCEWDSCKK